MAWPPFPLLPAALFLERVDHFARHVALVVLGEDRLGAHLAGRLEHAFGDHALTLAKQVRQQTPIGDLEIADAVGDDERDLLVRGLDERAGLDEAPDTQPRARRRCFLRPLRSGCRRTRCCRSARKAKAQPRRRRRRGLRRSAQGGGRGGSIGVSEAEDRRAQRIEARDRVGVGRERFMRVDQRRLGLAGLMQHRIGANKAGPFVDASAIAGEPRGEPVRPCPRSSAAEPREWRPRPPPAPARP